MIWVELCCGAGATTLRLLGGPDMEPVVAWMGGKRRHASAILAAMGLEPWQGAAEVVLVDASEWGWVWKVLLDAELGPRVANALRTWEELLPDPRGLWDMCRAWPPPPDPAIAAAQWLWMQARSASGAPVWWESADGRRGVWVAVDGRGSARPAGQKGAAWTMGSSPTRGTLFQPPAQAGEWKQGSGDREKGQPAGQRGRWANGDWSRPGKSQGAGQSHTGRLAAGAQPGQHQHQKAASAPRVGGIQKPSTIARRIDALQSLQSSGTTIRVIHADVREVEPIADAVVYFDPDYEGRTAYQCSCPRTDVVAVAQRWNEAGCVVAISEAVDLVEDLPGWWAVDLSPRSRQGAKTPEWLTMNRVPARVPEHQLGLGF